jgi:UDP-glucose 4-epimerase
MKFSIKNSSFLVTGGTGSFGSVMVERLLQDGASLVRVFSRDENKQYELSGRVSNPMLEFALGDIRDLKSIEKALVGIDYVFHAAALKHVPFSELTPIEYLKTNTVGSNNLLAAIANSGVRSAVFLSTDKAAYPVNVMGMTKALMEKLVRAYHCSGSTKVCVTRYGNVIASRGSVIPYMINQIKNNRPVSITDWKMTRFMMSLEDSINLVLHALANGSSGDLFVKKAKAASLSTILTSIEILLGQKATKITVDGVRPGEKIHETLLTPEELHKSRESNEFFQVPAVPNELDLISQKYQSGPFELGFRSDNAEMFEAPELADLLAQDKQIARIIK